MKLTDTFIRRVNGNGKVQKHSDGGGLFLYVTPTGKKSWRMAYRFAGKQKLLAIGPYPTVGLREARDKREEAMYRPALGVKVFLSWRDECGHVFGIVCAMMKSALPALIKKSAFSAFASSRVSGSRFDRLLINP